MELSEEIPITIQYKFVTGNYIANILNLDVPLCQLPSRGTLSDGQYFAATTPGQVGFRLFETKGDYIASVINHHFSRNSVTHDPYMQICLAIFKGVPVGSLKSFPRLALIGAQPEEIIHAVDTKLPHLKFVNKGHLGSLICRRHEPYENFEDSYWTLARKLYVDP
ncbi:unnamed protein product [Rodentolepis nana]|uniref:MOSC domain-containing protein n=1 Tax=Rodentolepis nana TaxID=102285 RepID=A0A0R3TAI5_RODNA|nr:unnamed protein product [Rodentolepis nana]